MKLNGKQYDKFILNGKTYEKFYLNNKIYQSLDPGLILDLPLQNNFTDYSASGISMVAGNANGLPSFISDGSGGYAVDFTGTKTLKTSTNLPINTSDRVTIICEVKTTATAVQMMLELSPNAGSNNAFYVTINENPGKLWLLDRASSTNIVNSNSNINSGIWIKVALIIDRALSKAQNKILFNDILDFTQKPTPNNGDNNGVFGSYPLFIGQRNGSSSGFIGQMKNLKIYNYPIL